MTFRDFLHGLFGAVTDDPAEKITLAILWLLLAVSLGVLGVAVVSLLTDGPAVANLTSLGVGAAFAFIALNTPA